MVTLHQSQVAIMPRHKLQCTKTSKRFKEGQIGDYYIARFSDGRYGVMTASYTEKKHQYEVFESDKALDDHFHEIALA